MQSRIAGFDKKIVASTASAAVQWMWNEFGPRSCLLASMQDAVLIDIAMTVVPRMPIVFLDNGYHFQATLDTVDRVEHRYGIDVEVVSAAKGVPVNGASGKCCDAKIALLERALVDRDAWMSGIQRSQTANRGDTPIVGRDRRGKVKVSPLAQWSDADRKLYIDEKDVITHPLLEEGYDSIGCEPCTTRPAGDPRSGRWADSDRTECGLHL